jgi:F420-dependent oxidoreductase-like protein
MRTATTVEFGTGWRDSVALVLEAERLGMDVCWVAEAWGADAPSPLGYLAAKTSTILLGSGVIQVGTRTPVAVAMTALTLAQLSEGRFLLGLGSSGPQVIEGLHGQPFERPLTRMRETIEVIRSACAGEKIDFDGQTVRIPRPDGEARPMRLATEPNSGIPIYVASLSPRMLRLTGAVADGWLGTSFVPEGAAAYLEPLSAGAESAGRSLADLDICQGAEVAFAADEKSLAQLVGARKKELAFSLGGMGSASTNYYNDAYSRQGWADVAAEVHRLWQAGAREDATALVTEEMVLATTLIGTEAMVRERLQVWQAAGVTTVRLYPAGETLDERLTTLGRAIDLVRGIGAG